jgi:hypothetical protein
MDVKISIYKPVSEPNDIRIWISNDSENIIIVKRIILTVDYPTIQALYYLRNDDFYVGEVVDRHIVLCILVPLNVTKNVYLRHINYMSFGYLIPLNAMSLL